MTKAAGTTRRTIAVVGEPIVNEYVAHEAITPGMLVSHRSDGKVAKNAGAGTVAMRTFALENDLAGGDISDDYASASIVQVGSFHSGQRVNAWLNNGESAVKGSLLESAGNGTLRVHVTDSSAATIDIQAIVGMATEAVDMSGSSGEDPSGRILIEIL